MQVNMKKCDINDARHSSLQIVHACKDPYWFFLQGISWASMPNNILDQEKLYLSIQQGRIA